MDYIKGVLLSVIVPVYKVEQWLNRCIESIVSCDIIRMEVILVDDGSPDMCPALCDEWEKRDSRIKVIHKENGGLSDARNAGLDIAQGKYVTFVDSDDYLECNPYAELLDTLERNNDIDIIEYSVREHASSKKEHLLKLDDRYYYTAHQYWLNGMAYTHSYAWNKIYKRELFRTIRFPAGVVYEDMHTLPLLLSKTQLVVTSSAGLYNYQWNSKGITATSSGHEMKMLLAAHLKQIDFYAPLAKTDSDARRWFCIYYMYVLNIQITTYMMTGETPLLSYFPVEISKDMPVSMRIKAKLVRIFKVKNLCRIMIAAHKLGLTNH